MNLKTRSISRVTVRLVTCLSLLLCTLGVTSPQAEEAPAAEKVLPGLNEVIPQATAVAAQITEADGIISQAGSLGTVYQQFLS